MSTPHPAAIAVQTFKVSADRVYDAFLDADTIRQFMFGPELRDEEIVHVRLDPVVGGRFSYKVRRDIPGHGPTDIDHVGEFLELKRPSRIVFTWAVVGDSDDDPSTVTIDITPVPEGCMLTLTHSMAPKWADYVDRARGSWEKMLARLGAVLA